MDQTLVDQLFKEPLMFFRRMLPAKQFPADCAHQLQKIGIFRAERCFKVFPYSFCKSRALAGSGNCDDQIPSFYNSRQDKMTCLGAVGNIAEFPLPVGIRFDLKIQLLVIGCPDDKEHAVEVRRLIGFLSQFNHSGGGQIQQFSIGRRCDNGYPGAAFQKLYNLSAANGAPAHHQTRTVFNI